MAGKALKVRASAEVLQIRLVRALPLVAAILLAALWRQQAADDRLLGAFAWHAAMATLAAVPFIAAHALALSMRPAAALAAWLAGFVIYPVAVHLLVAADRPGTLLPSIPESTVAALFSAAALLLGGREGYRLRGGDVAALLRRMPVTLDGAVIALLCAWTMATTSLFASTADAVRNQPLSVWFDPARISAHPAEALGYLWQFAVVAVLFYGLYWGARHLLVRRMLGTHGWIPFALASVSYWVVATPIVGSIVMNLPLNLPDWTILPSETRDPFDPINFGFTFGVLALVLPIVLAGERLLAEQRDASGRHALVRAELDLLQQQINPHFLFNSLNTIYALCLRDRAESGEAVLKLSDLLRYTVYEGQREWVRLDDEIVYLRNYLDLQMLRLGDRCAVRCDWPDEARHFCVPPLLLIMLVENAFKHGIEPSDRASRIGITASLDADTLRFVCENSLDPDVESDGAPGLGLSNLRRRLELILGDGFSLTSRRDGDRWRAELELELRPC
ncbi:histidine kinase [Parerythrobacter aurantius]|uniref:sensor histidine kinase n=1 Tax=Parerythrobacter aurantius TaxID=3127706 RepID=UPI003243E049